MFCWLFLALDAGEEKQKRTQTYKPRSFMLMLVELSIAIFFFLNNRITADVRNSPIGKVCFQIYIDCCISDDYTRCMEGKKAGASSSSSVCVFFFLGGAAAVLPHFPLDMPV